MSTHLRRKCETGRRLFVGAGRSVLNGCTRCPRLLISRGQHLRGDWEYRPYPAKGAKPTMHLRGLLQRERVWAVSVTKWFHVWKQYSFCYVPQVIAQLFQSILPLWLQSETHGEVHNSAGISFSDHALSLALLLERLRTPIPNTRISAVRLFAYHPWIHYPSTTTQITVLPQDWNVLLKEQKSLRWHR